MRDDSVEMAIARLREAAHMSETYYHKPLVMTFSGGKDSSVCVHLAQIAGIRFELMHNHTTIDAPETVMFVREEFRRLETMGIKCAVNYPVYKGERTSMWSLIRQKLMPPTRIARYCCLILKEQANRHRYIVTGVRWAESVKRKADRGIYETVHTDKAKRIVLANDNDDRRRLFERCAMKAAMICNPIIDWSDGDVWDYVHAEKLLVNPLYNCGFNRVGCIGCPMGGLRGRLRAFARYPKYKTLYLRAFARMLTERERRGMKRVWETPEDVFHWWMEDGVLPGQIALAEFDQEE